MELIKCIAGVIMSRTAMVFGGEFPNFWAGFDDLEEFCKSISSEDYNACMQPEKCKGYDYLTQVILKGDKIAQNVLDLSVAQLLFPKFGLLLRRYTGYGANLENASKIEDGGFEVDKLLKAYRLLRVLYDTDDTTSYFQTEHFCDNRILALINGDKDSFMPEAVVYKPPIKVNEVNGIEEIEVSGFEAGIKTAIVNNKPFGLVTREDSVDTDIIWRCASRAGRGIVYIDGDFVEKDNCQRVVWQLVREAVINDACIFVSGINDKNCKAVINMLKIRTQGLDIAWGIGIPRDVLQAMKFTDFREIEIFYDKNLKKKKKISVPCGMLEEPDKFITMEDLIIPARQKENLERICYHVRHEKKVYSDWGMEEKYRYGKGTPVLFAGPPGTGKTMAAHVLSNMLDVPLYKIDLSQVADKYIGETEKHLQRVFEFADENETLLFFDEADALFGKRGEVKESKDRYANMEISYILQRIEQFDGIAILATNIRENMDSAFIRRMKYIVDFPMPDKDMREQIWRNGFSGRVPMGDIDFDYLAGQFEFSGGNIKNIILTATFLAAGRNEKVEMSHIFESVENEYFKYNKKMTIKDFGKYGYMLL